MLEIQIENQIARLTLNHEDQGNSFGALDAEKLAKALKTKSLRGLILTGCGSRFFCTGGNLAEQSKAKNAKSSLDGQKKIRAALAALEKWPNPTLALVNGDCFGGGTELISSFDRVITVPHAMFGFWQRKLGLTYGWGGGARLLRRLGPKLFSESIGAKSFSAYHALEIGLVDSIVPETELSSRGDEWLKHVLSLPSYAECKALRATPSSESKIFEKLWMNPAHKKVVQTHSK